MAESDNDRDAVVIVAHTLAHTVGTLRAAARAGRRVTLVSAPDAGIYAGPGWFRGVIDAAREAVPSARFLALLDCGDRPGAALAAIRTEIEGVIFTGRADVTRRLADMAARHSVRLFSERPIAALDLDDDFFASEAAIEQRCGEFFASN